MELTIRDWMVIIGAGLILAVLVDAARRIIRERRTEIRLNAKVRRADDAADDEPFNLLAELPNGGARIVGRDDLAAPAGAAVAAQSITDESVSNASEATAIHREASAFESERAETPNEDDIPSFSALDDGVVHAVSSEPIPSETTGKSEPAAHSRIDPTPATLDWLEQLDEPNVEGEPQARLPRGIEPHVFVLNVLARTELGFAGQDILQILLACDLRFGDMDFFHRHEQAAGRGPIQFSVANMMRPGVFDIDAMDGLHTKGLMFFITLPGPEDMLKGFDYMYETAKAVAKNLDGDVLDETRSAVTRQSLEHMRQQIRELERRVAMERKR